MSRRISPFSQILIGARRKPSCQTSVSSRIVTAWNRPAEIDEMRAHGWKKYGLVAIKNRFHQCPVRKMAAAVVRIGCHNDIAFVEVVFKERTANGFD